MSRHIRLRELLAAVQGIALLRWQFLGSDEEAQRRVDELREIVVAPEPEPVDVPILDVGPGYAADRPGRVLPGAGAELGRSGPSRLVPCTGSSGTSAPR